MRTYIDIILNQFLTESKTTTVDVFGETVRVWINPTHTVFFGLLNELRELRGTTDIEGNLYTWDASLSIHQPIEIALSIAVQDRMMLKSHEILLEYDVDKEDLLRSHGIARAYGDFDFDVYNDSALDNDD